MINNFLIGGVERLFFDIISNFDKNKYDVEVITILGSGPLEKSFYSLGVPIRFACPWKLSSRRLPLKIYWLIIAPITLLRLVLFLLKSKPDIVFSSLYQADIVGMVASKIVGIKERIIFQGDVQKFNKVINHVKKIFALNLSTHIISNSETVKRFLIEHFKVESQKITTIYSGINYVRFEKGRKDEKFSSIPTIGIIGRLVEVKGHIYALQALKILKDKYNLSPDVLIAGDGPLRHELEKYVSENGLSGVKFLGSITDVVTVLQKIDILVVSSLSEGFGLVIIEGMVSGKVVVASDIEVMHELIVDGQDGLLFKQRNSVSLAEVLKKVLVNDNERKEIQKNTYISVEEKKKLYDVKEVSLSFQKFIDFLFRT